MLININTRTGLPIYRQIFDQVKSQILTGRLLPGAQLPSVRDLATELRINPMTVSKAYSLLVREDLLDNRRGVGLFVSDLSRPQHHRQSLEMFENVIRNAALLATQLGISRDEALQRFADFHDQFNSKGARK